MAGLEPLDAIELPLDDRRDGKVRVSWALGDDRRLFVTTDRLSAFDRIIARVPYKGQVLNQLAGWWFEQTSDIIANHCISLPDPNVLIARAARPLSVEVVVRGHITGVTDTALWTRYAAGERTIYGHRFPDGMVKNSPLPAPIVTPTTKGAHGTHDIPLSQADVVADGHVDAATWSQVEAAALAVFERGRELAAGSGLILADTKYEFGLGSSGELLLIDEVHTPDSSRYWVADSYEARLAAGDEPESLDKEFVRRALADAGYTGDGEIPELPATVWQQTSARYIETYERLTGRTFVPGAYPAAQRIADTVAALEII
ncbi:MAG: phosphoribosylaminoimidazolesuccinocarboxamide synthase [Ilumatobacter sp.]|nr:phosphoribosylaminoimidazolesuccinocarboxamide synthase [Ilumatobacter sp.]